MNSGGLTPPASTVVDVVVDASVAVKWFVPEEYTAEALRLLDNRFHRHVPMLFYSEVGQTIWKKVYQRKEIKNVDGRSILGAITATALDPHPVAPLLESAFDIALATGRTVYDSIYLALAAGLGCKFMTADRKLYNALRGGPFHSDTLWIADPI